jgi:RND superfamily putative drug exporter
MASTGRVVCTASLIMAVVFSSFATGRLVLLEQLGLGLAGAVLIDTFLVRLTLVPAIMAILGRWNWYWPTWTARKQGTAEGPV